MRLVGSPRRSNSERGAEPPSQYEDKSPRASSAATSRWRIGRKSPKGRAQVNGPEVVLPRHVRACQHSHDRRQRWFVWTWKRESPAVQTRVPYSCRSWRCPVCARHEAAVTFARIKQATERPEFESDGWCYFVLTLDRNGYFSGERRWANVTEAYRELGQMSEKLLKRLRRAYPELGSAWVAVVEAHRSGWPHLNLMVYCPELARELRTARASRLGATQREAAALAVLPRVVRERLQRQREREAVLLGGHLLDHAMECGWGRQSTAEGVRDTDALAGYIVKLAGQHDASVGELAKVTQAPLAAPERFRRLRSGKGFLPPRYKNPAVTGCLLRRRRAPSGEWEIGAVNKPRDPEQAEPVEQAIRAEQQTIEAEENELAQCRRLTPRPVRIAVAGQLESDSDALERTWAAEVRALECA